ncbi:uncharacterized protein DFL_004078 [Arthrobotrys flagrans]|uniref:Extracellular membrane protein CFEM domain-containing protein n=1 Tax=Arthrobotrys flagrans TaxID=97331 RepID=A0A437A3Q9_ARTFL|nr:hypothetical protein DFL_004078 [Arthrobotrys flagrans]
MVPLHILACILSLHLVAFTAAHSAQAKLSAANAVANLPAPNIATITPAPKIPPTSTPLQRRQNSESIAICSSYRTFLNCEGEFDTVYPLCACYTSGTFAGSYVDGLARTCSQYLSSVSGSAVAAPFASFTSFCASAGDIAALLTSTIRACESINSRDRACATEPSNLELYGTLSARAACACYSGTVFSGSRNDGWASTCYEKASIAGDSFASTIREFTALCTRLGDVRASAEDLAANCGKFETVFSSCLSDTVGFEGLPASEQASCLCYSGADWVVAEADNAVGTCLQYASRNFQHRVSLYSPYEGLCSSAGDVRAEAQATGGSDRTTTRPSPAPTGPSGSQTYTGASTSTSDSNNPQPPQENNGGSSGLSGGALAGVIAGAVVGTALLAALGFFTFWRSRRSGAKPVPPPAGYGGMDGDGALGGIEQEVGGISDKNEYQSVPIPPPPMARNQQSQPMR